MRQVRENQPSFPLHQCEHRHGQELEQISRILDENPTLAEVVVQHLESDSGRGAPGMSGEQILRCAVIKKLEGLSYDRLTFALEDSLTLRDFCRFSFQKAPKRSTLAENISRIGPGVWKQIADTLTQWAARTGLEKGRKVRIDATPISCSIRQPTDNQLLYDAVRVLTRLLAVLSAKADFAWTDHTRRAKKRHMKILNSRRQALRLAPYRDLLRVACLTRSYVDGACQAAVDVADPVVSKLVRKLRHFADLTDRVIAQTRRRVLEGESVPAAEKVVSIFEEHADILRKGTRETVYGHKLYLTCGKSSLITDCMLVRGNPADSGPAAVDAGAPKPVCTAATRARRPRTEALPPGATWTGPRGRRGSRTWPSPRSAVCRWRRWLSPPGSTASCAASVPASKAASRTSSVPLEAAAATGRVGRASSNTCICPWWLTTCWCWRACACPPEVGCADRKKTVLEGGYRRSVRPVGLELRRLRNIHP